MGRSTCRQDAQDKTLAGFRNTLRGSGSFDNKPLTLAEQLAQVDNQPTIKRASDDSEIEKRYNDPVYSEVRAIKK